MDQKENFNSDISIESYVPKIETWSDYEEIKISRFKL